MDVCPRPLPAHRDDPGGRHRPPVGHQEEPLTLHEVLCDLAAMLAAMFTFWCVAWGLAVIIR